VIAYQLLFGRRAYYAALAVTGVLVPGLAGFATSVLYFLGRDEKSGLAGTLNKDGAHSFLYGSAIALGAWLVGAFLFQRYGRVDGSNPMEYARLRAQHGLLRSRLDAVKDRDAWYEVANKALDRACALLRPGKNNQGIRWASQSGYVLARAEIDSAETALIAHEPIERLPAIAKDLRLRIEGSRMGGSALLLESLHSVDEDLALEDAIRRDARVPSARARLTQVKETVDAFRDSRRYGLVSARSGLYGTVVLAGTLAYSLLGLALIWGAGPEHVLAAIVFYLVGAVVGLFRQLAAAGAADTQVEEDYGLDDARLIQRPLFSGVAAIGGAALMTFGVVLGSNNVLTSGAGGQVNPTTSTQPSVSTTTTGGPRAREVKPPPSLGRSSTST
jgi:hypothetical protein